MIGSLVVLGVVFALGVLVGKQLAADALAQTAPIDPLAAIDAQEARVAAAVAPDAATGPELAADEPEPEPPQLTFAQELTRPNPVEPKLEVPAPAPAKAPEPRDEPKKVVAKPEPVEAKAVEPKPATETERRQGIAAAFEKVAPKAAAPKGDGFALQVSSFPDRQSAEKFASTLTAKGYAPFVVEADVPGKGRYFRVKVGSFDTRGEADAFLESFRARTSLQAFVTSVR